MTTPPSHTHTVSKIMGLCGLQDARQWKCSNSDKIWARNYWYHTKCVSVRLDHKTNKWKLSCLTRRPTAPVCSNSAKIWVRNYWYHTKCVSGRLDHKTNENLSKFFLLFSWNFPLRGTLTTLPWKIINLFPTIFHLFCGLIALKHIYYDTGTS